MKRFIILVSFTEQGMKNIQDSPARADAFRAEAEAAGITINALYWTIGGYDGVISLDAPDEEAAAALMVKLGSAGNVRTQTLQAFQRDAVDRILAKVGS